MHRLSFLVLLLAGCEIYDYSSDQHDYTPAVVPDSGPGCNVCPSQSSWGQTCGAHQLGTACLYNTNEVCACINYQWRCGYVSGVDAGIPDAWIPPDAG